MVVALFFYFAGFNFLDASLPSLIAKAAPAGSKGTAMGIYSSAQFFGIFVGGVGGGVLLKHFGVVGVFTSATILAIVWLLIACKMPAPKYLSTKVVKLNQVSHLPDDLMQALLKIKGVEEAFVVSEQQVAHLKVDKSKLDEAALAALTQA